MTVALAAILAAGIVLPHVLRLQRVAPMTAVVLWLSALGLRALASLIGVVYLLFFLPRTDVFASLTHWCLHAALPLVADGLGVEGHGIGDLMLLVPGVVLAASLVVVCIRTARTARAARQLVADHELGQGPRDSVIVSGPEVLFAVAGLKGPRVVVSAGALASLDDDELAAALDHERGHIARHHRFVMLAAVTLSALGRVLPGTSPAVREIGFHLERDADRWALRNRNDRLALARVICKAAATAEPSGHAAVARLGATGVRERLGQLLDEPPRRHATALNVVATAMVSFTLLLAGAVPTAAVAGAGSDAHDAHHGEHCDH
jgi:Zn-dependent protease with chaperone function